MLVKRRFPLEVLKVNIEYWEHENLNLAYGGMGGAAVQIIGTLYFGAVVSRAIFSWRTTFLNQTYVVLNWPVYPVGSDMKNHGIW